MDFDKELLRAIDTHWCGKDFRQGDACYSCKREDKHTGKCDSYLAQERRREFCEQLLGEGVTA